jgi:hypothetical protein
LVEVVGQPIGLGIDLKAFIKLGDRALGAEQAALPVIGVGDLFFAGGTGKNCRWPKAKRFLLRWCYRNTNRFAQQVPTGGAKYPVFSMAHQTGANRVCVHVSQLFFYFGFAVNVKNVILRLPHGTIQIDLEAILN